jgi:polysaccharide biosynthesis/export protein
MNVAFLIASVIALSVGGCSWLPRAGPSASDVVGQGQAQGEILFDIVDVDERVVSALLGQPKESFAQRFKAADQPPDLKIAVGDTLSVLIWESAAGGLFTEPAPTSFPGAKPETEPLSPESRPPRGERQNELAPPGRPENQRRREDPPGDVPSFGISGTRPGGNAAVIPSQQVEADGSISVPYAGRIPAAGHSPEEVQKTIEARLAEKALQPQALVIVEKSAANAVTVLLNETGGVSAAGVVKPSISDVASAISNPVPGIPVGAEAPSIPGQAASKAGARVPLSPGGDRLLQVIAAAEGAQAPVLESLAQLSRGGVTAAAEGAKALVLESLVQLSRGGVTAATEGAKAPVHESFVQLSRDGVTATIPLQQLVSDPAEDIYAQPGDVLTLIRVPRTFSVFGATGRNAQIPFDAEGITMAEALAKSQGLDDNLANPEGAFLFRYEPNSVVNALNQPIATRSQGGSSPVAYRFNFRNGKSYLLAQQFPIRDKDVIFVADAGAAQAQKLFTLLQTVTGPVITGLLVCTSGNTKC